MVGPGILTEMRALAQDRIESNRFFHTPVGLKLCSRSRVKRGQHNTQSLVCSKEFKGSSTRSARSSLLTLCDRSLRTLLRASSETAARLTWAPEISKRSEEHTSELQSLAYLVC